MTGVNVKKVLTLLCLPRAIHSIVYKKCTANCTCMVPILHMIKDETVQIIHNNRKLVSS